MHWGFGWRGEGGVGVVYTGREKKRNIAPFMGRSVYVRIASARSSVWGFSVGGEEEGGDHPGNRFDGWKCNGHHEEIMVVVNKKVWGVFVSEKELCLLDFGSVYSSSSFHHNFGMEPV